MNDQLSALLRAVGIDLGIGEQERLLAYQALVAEANATQNLTALRSPEVFLREGILDSLLAWRAMDLPAREILDVGSGSGLPGLVWLAAGCASKAVLIEAERRKAEFLRSAAVALGLDVEVRWGRAEEEARGGLRDGHAVVAARAVAAAGMAVEICGGLVRPGGHLVLLKGEPGRAGAEAGAAAAVATRMGFGRVEMRKYRLAEGIERTLLLYRKERPTPAGRPVAYARLRREFASPKGVPEREGGSKGE